MIGGTETLPKVFAGAVHQLARNPDQRARVASEPALAADAFSEALRTEMPTQMLGRTLREEVVIHGERLRPGQKAMFLWACANRDEREFVDPEGFDLGRRAPRILSFGHATHRCLGHNVARMEGRVLLEELLARIPDYDVEEERAGGGARSGLAWRRPGATPKEALPCAGRGRSSPRCARIPPTRRR